MEERIAEKHREIRLLQQARKTSMSVPEMRRLLGLGKTEAYWLVRKQYFKTVVAGGRMRIMISSFEEWYANQFTYCKVDGPPPGENLKDYIMSLTEMAQSLGISEGTAEGLLTRINLERMTICGRRWILRHSFEEWYQSQNFYRTVADQEKDRMEHGETITMPEIARMLGVKRHTVYGLVKAGKFETVKTVRTTLVKKGSFEKWYQEQSRYKMLGTEKGGTKNGVDCEEEE